MSEHPRRLVLWRHGRTAWNVEHRFQGKTDVPLDEMGRRQALSAAGLLAALHPQLIVSSDLSRARDTAAALADRVGMSVLTDPRLRETDGGSWEGRRREDLLATDPHDYRAWLAGEPVRPGGDGEHRTEVGERVKAAIEDALARTDADGTLVVVTHGGAARAVLGPLLNRPFEQVRFFSVMRNAAWSVFLESDSPDNPWQVLEYNARSLPEPPAADD
jgi:probable phosphoglycerate mutase